MDAIAALRNALLVATGAVIAAPAGSAPTLHGRIVFEAQRTLRPGGLVVMAADGSHRVRLPGTHFDGPIVVTAGEYAYTRTSSATEHVIVAGAGRSRDLGPGTPAGFSPDGRTIVVATRDSSWELRDAASGIVEEVFPATLRYIGWSASGLLFSKDLDLVVMQPDGSGERVVGRSERPDRAVWAPNGAWIAYLAQPDPTVPPQLHVVRPDGSDDHTLATASPYDKLLWSPNGTEIAFASPQGSLAFAAPDANTPLETRVDVSTTAYSIGSWSPDGSRFASTTVTSRGRTGPVTIVSAATGAARIVGSVGQTVSWSPNGKTLMIGVDNGMSVVSVTATNAHPKVLAPNVQSPTWLSDGRVLAYLNAETVEQLGSVAPTGGAVRYIRGTQDVHDPAPSPDGTKIAFAALSEKTGLWTIFVAAVDGDRRRVLAHSDANLPSPTWSPDGRFIAYAVDGAIDVIPAAGGRPRHVTEAELPWTVAWSPHGKEIAFGNTPGDSDYADVVVVNSDGTHRRVVVHGDAGINWGAVAWSPTGRTLAVARRSDQGGDPDGNADLYLVDLRAHHEREIGLYLSDPSFSPDGKQLAVASDDGTVDVIDLHTRGTRTLAAGSHPFWSR